MVYQRDTELMSKAVEEKVSQLRKELEHSIKVAMEWERADVVRHELDSHGFKLVVSLP